jgi:coatomer protein complex subunit epsilon
MGDQLFPVYNNFFIGNYQVAINEGYELSGLSDADTLERDCYVYRSHIALGHYQLVLDEIPEDGPSALRAVRLLATYKSRSHEREQCVSTIHEWLSDVSLASNAVVQLMSALIFAEEDNVIEAMKCCHTALSLELMALMIHLLVKHDRPELAEKHLRMMQAADDDATLTQLATAWVNLALGGSKTRDAFYVYQELGDKYTWTSKLYNGAAVCEMAMGLYEDAEKNLVEAINKDSKDPDTLQNLAVCCLHLGKPTSRFVNQLKTLTPKPKAISILEEFEKQFDDANAAYAATA